MTLDALIEAVLFWKAEPVSVKKLAEILEKSEQEIVDAIASLKNTLTTTGVARGLTLIELDGAVTLGTHPEASATIEKIAKEDLVKDLGKAGLETISIILYQGPISRAEIDYIRGVNSQFIIRNLLIRDLIEKVENPNDRRAFHYKPSMRLLAHMGLSNIESLPEFQNIRAHIAAFKAAGEENTSETSQN